MNLRDEIINTLLDRPGEGVDVHLKFPEPVTESEVGYELSSALYGIAYEIEVKDENTLILHVPGTVDV